MKQYRNEIFSFLMLMAGVLLEYAQTSWFARDRQGVRVIEQPGRPCTPHFVSRLKPDF